MKMDEKVKEWSSDDLFELAYSYWKSCAFHTAVKLDIFTVLGKEQMPAAVVAKKLNLDERATDMLLTALTSLKLLKKDNGTYEAAPSIEKLLSRNSSEYAGYMALHHHNIIVPWTKLNQAIKTGKPIDAKEALDRDGTESWWVTCIQGMISLSLDYAAHIAEEVDLSEFRSMLDFAGGPGIYAINFCLRNPQLKATLYDLPLTRQVAEEMIQKYGMQDQVTFKGGNYREDWFEPQYDLVWLSHVVHSESPQFCQDLIHNAVRCLRPGGKIMVHDYYLNDEKNGPVHPALFALNMLLLTCDGQSYSRKEVMEMLSNAGVKNLEYADVKGQLESGIIVGNI